MSKPTVVVLGCTGYIGTATVNTLSSEFTDKVQVRACCRDPTKETAIRLKASNVDLVQGDMSDPSSLDKIINQGDAVFVITPGHQERTKLTIAGIDAAKRNGASFVMVISVPTTATDSIFGRQVAPIEQHIRECGIPYCILRLPFFIDNVFANQQAIKDGKYYSPSKPDAPFTPVAVADAGACAATILADWSKHKNSIYTLTSKTHTHQGYVDAFSKVLGRKVEYVQVSYDDAKKSFMDLGMPEWQTDGVLELFRYFDAGAALTNNPTGDIKSILGRDPIDAEAWMQKAKGAFE
eukprot:m.161005 g.161005  ORF g.161005 m.161005 type:complete len:294 (-) comp16369_c2_seq1:1483-2364(-)